MLDILSEGVADIIDQISQEKIAILKQITTEVTDFERAIEGVISQYDFSTAPIEGIEALDSNICNMYQESIETIEAHRKRIEELIAKKAAILEIDSALETEAQNKKIDNYKHSIRAKLIEYHFFRLNKINSIVEEFNSLVDSMISEYNSNDSSMRQVQKVANLYNLRQEYLERTRKVGEGIKLLSYMENPIKFSNESERNLQIDAIISYCANKFNEKLQDYYRFGLSTAIAYLPQDPDFFVRHALAFPEGWYWAADGNPNKGLFSLYGLSTKDLLSEIEFFESLQDEINIGILDDKNKTTCSDLEFLTHRFSQRMQINGLFTDISYLSKDAVAANSIAYRQFALYSVELLRKNPEKYLFQYRMLSLLINILTPTKTLNLDTTN